MSQALGADQRGLDWHRATEVVRAAKAALAVSAQNVVFLKGPKLRRQDATQ